MQSRLSRVPFKARESIFTGNPDIYRGDIQSACPAALAECVMALEDCCEETYESEKLVRDGTRDLPRMSRVLDNERVFLLVDEGTIRRYKADLIDEVEPAINELIERAEQGLERMQKKESVLEAKLEAVQTRPAKPAIGTNVTHKLEIRRLQMLKKQREKLEEEARALEVEIQAMEASPRKRIR
ncbi:hypothetical protein PC9H_004729 [Pleurotus ostreatus]|uniref:DASH complex subunit SPC19 n=1 Tax=Pleurotus ostreatus TaxID=5322 RepID=A0A8H7DS96_PLEOS|nr:uncharacterized protein PC9H_004729 [Pleurotus ostreatus]KAF7432786.1 hypothetical protein PC9H_004729 [Pleurotus ostreatus]KAJ8698667.1 hypothetical protein PTI98_005349 [Pleurotus ostreatus]